MASDTDRPIDQPEPPERSSDRAEEAGSDADTKAPASRRGVAAAVDHVVRTIEHVGSAVAHEVGEVAGGAGRVVRERAPRPKRRRTSRVPLPFLYDVHPEARNAAPRERGVRLVPLDEIVGTTVSSVRRGMDFLPMDEARTPGWQAKWDRILSAMNRLAPLPPVDLYRYGGRYWVSDGHNRIGAAHRFGQLAVDANVIDLIGEGPAEPATPIAGYLDESAELRGIGEGRRVHRHTEGDVESEERYREELDEPEDPA